LLLPLTFLKPGLLIVSQRYKSRMPQMLIRRPLHKLKIAHQHRLEPPTVFHLYSRQAFSPASGPSLRQVRERTLRGLKVPEPLVQLFARTARVNPLRVRAAYIRRSPSQ
jgi:hypothetical protein